MPAPRRPLGGVTAARARKTCSGRMYASPPIDTIRIIMAETLAQQHPRQPIDEGTEQFLEQAARSKFDFHQVSVKAAGDERLKTAINNAVLRQYTGRQLRLLDLPDPEALRTLAGDIKQHALDYLDYYLEQLATNVR